VDVNRLWSCRNAEVAVVVVVVVVVVVSITAVREFQWGGVKNDIICTDTYGIILTLTHTHTHRLISTRMYPSVLR